MTALELNLAPGSPQSQTGALVEQLHPLTIQLPRVAELVPPLEPSMLMISNPPGPTLLKLRVVETPKQGQPGPDSSGCV